MFRGVAGGRVLPSEIAAMWRIGAGAIRSKHAQGGATRRRLERRKASLRGLGQA